MPLTLLELHFYLLDDLADIKKILNEQWEVKEGNENNSKTFSIDEILKCLDNDCQVEVESERGFYCLRGRKKIIEDRLKNYSHGIYRERIIKKYVWFLACLPFVRGVALSGSQALGQQKQSSDIDLFIVTDPAFLWLARTLVTGYFQILGRRRHGNNITNRFCLNHYIAAPKEVSEYKNLYTAAEYAKLRPLVYPKVIYNFQKHNQEWIKRLFPNAQFLPTDNKPPLAPQSWLEKLFTNGFGYWLEKKLQNWQLPKIRTEEKFIVVKKDELSFHPQSKQQLLLENFFKLQQQNMRKTEQLIV